MLKVAILDDYQNVSQSFLNLKKLDGKYEFKIFNEAFVEEDEAGEQLKDYEAILIMRERTKITKSLINQLTKLKFIITSGMRNKAIDLDAAKQRKIIVCGTEINSNPTAELTWALILGLVRNLKEEIDNTETEIINEYKTKLPMNNEYKVNSFNGFYHYDPKKLIDSKKEHFETFNFFIKNKLIKVHK